MTITKAVKKNQKLKLLIEGVSGSGKTYSALRLAKGLAGENAKIVVLDTESGSASLYSDKFDFYTTELRPPYSPQNYILKIEEIEKFKADVCIIDSMSMIWSGQGGCLDMQIGLGGRFTDWAKVTPQYEKFMNKILQSNMHIICTARTKTDWVVEVNEKGKSVPQKVGLKTEARDGTDYTFTIVFRLNQNHYASCLKDRTGKYQDECFIIDEKLGEDLKLWLSENIDNSITPSSNNQAEHALSNSSEGVFLEQFKETCKRLMTGKQIKLFMKQNKLNIDEPQKIIELMKKDDYSLDLEIAKFLDEVEK